ncbi:unnamed protein product [Adineta ricciae]|uniref:RRM domain-containing protein n=1 Tax=Adineta ricciae TaxID=249248 RepID=A0A816DKD1_ADIRI|nr:unnamed protein product [Adineta ricciae]
MSSKTSEIPTMFPNENEMKDLLKYLYEKQSILEEFGAIKLIPPDNFGNLLKKTSMNFCSSSTIQQVQQIRNSNSIYSIKTNPIERNDQIIHDSCRITNQIFWLLLPNSSHIEEISSISHIIGKSLFLKRVHRSQFDFHQLPSQSLLKLLGKKNLHDYSSDLIKAHGPAAIFPLSSTKQNLCQFNYLHRGSKRFWYIIPTKQRFVLQNLMQQIHPEISLESDQILIDPILFNEHGIKYYEVTQNANEILILSSGILSQSFTEDEILCESIHFALPNWISNSFTKQSNDLNVFNRENIEKYIEKQLKIHKEQTKIAEVEEWPTNHIDEEDFIMDICDQSIDLMRFENKLLSLEDFHLTNQYDSFMYEDILDILSSPSALNTQSTNENLLESLQISNPNRFVLKSHHNSYEIDVKNILHLSNINKQINKNNLRSFFIDSTKIILKQSEIPPHLNYAFIFHRTNHQAEFNRQRFLLNPSIFGAKSQIKFAKTLPDEDQVDEIWNLVVRQIPENVSEIDLKNLFFNCEKIKFIPGRSIEKSKSNSKFLPGYAFLAFQNSDQVDEILQNSHRYQINNQSLHISYFNKTNF